MNAPKLRFEEFSDDWILTNLEAITSNITAGKSKFRQTEYHLYPVLGSTGVIGYSDTYDYDGNFILIARVGANAGKITAFNGQCKITDNTIFFESNKAETGFLIELLKKHDLSKKSFGSGQPLVKASEVKSLSILVPSLKEQNKIGDFFKKINLRIKLQQDKIDLLKEQKKGYMQKIFSQELRFTDEKAKPFPDWENTTLGEISEIIGGGTPSTDNQEFWVQEVPWFTPSEIGKNKYVSKSNRMISHKGLQKSSAKLLPKGTVLLTTRASLGDMAILKVEASTNQGFQSLLPLESTSSEFIYYLQPLIKKYCYLKASGSTFLEISKHNLKAMRLKLPSKDEQDKIVAFLSGLDRKIVQEQKIFYLLNSQKQAFMQQMFI